MDPMETLGVFGDFDPTQYDGEARARWGNTNAYRASARRTKSYAKADWEKIRDQNRAVDVKLISAFDRGIASDANEAMSIAEEARQIIDQAFYPCSLEMHRQLAEMYVVDERFRSHYNDQRQGLAAWFSEAIRANNLRARDRSISADEESVT